MRIIKIYKLRVILRYRQYFKGFLPAKILRSKIWAGLENLNPAHILLKNNIAKKSKRLFCRGKC